MPISFLTIWCWCLHLHKQMFTMKRSTNTSQRSTNLLIITSLILSLNNNGIIKVGDAFSGFGNNGGKGGNKNNNRFPFFNSPDNNGNNNGNNNNNPILPFLATAAVIAAPKTKSLLVSSSSSSTATKTRLDNNGGTPTKGNKDKKKALFSMFDKIFKKEDLMKEEEKPPMITSITIQNSTLLPPSLISYAKARSSIIGSDDAVSSIQSFSKYIREWYTQHGYILNAIRNVHVTADGECIISVQEYKSSESMPVEFVFVKPMIYDNATSSYLTLKQYRTAQLESSSSSSKNTKFTKREDFPNITYVPQQQHQSETSSSSISSSSSIKTTRKWHKALKVTPGGYFAWDEENWKEKSTKYFSSLIRNVLQVEPKLLDDGTVCLQLVVEENPMKSLEYGVTRSLYTGTWEGEINFQHGNVFGSGEKLGVVVTRSPSVTNLEKEPSWNIYYRDDKLGGGNAYSITLFNDFVSQQDKQLSTVFQGETQDANEIEDLQAQSSQLGDEEEPLIRRGMTFQLYPLSHKNRSNIISYMKLNMERVCMNKGLSNENILSSQCEIGPFLRSFSNNDNNKNNNDILQSIGMNVNTGIRFKELPIRTSSTTSSSSFTPFSVIAWKIQHIINNPLTKFFNANNNGIKLAFQQKISSYSNKLPIHELNALFLSTPIRGCSTTTPIPTKEQQRQSSSSIFNTKTLISGISELRFPTWNIPIKEYNFDINCLLFHDWMIHGDIHNVLPLSSSSSSTTSPLSNNPTQHIWKKHSFGIGLRKVIQGIPIKYDICFDVKDGLIKNVFGIGNDFDL